MHPSKALRTRHGSLDQLIARKPQTWTSFKVRLRTASSQASLTLSTDWAAYFLAGDHAAYSPYLYQLYSLFSTAKSYILPLIDQVSRKPDLATIALLLIIVFVSLKILNMLVQTLLFWFRLARSVVFWGGLVVLGLWMWSRGPEGMVQDVFYWQEQWGKEYGYWKDKERVARAARQGLGSGGRQRQTGWF